MSNFITITATSIQNAAGTPLASGTLSFQAVDNTGSPIAFRVGGNGQVITSPVITPISAGAIGSFQVADPSQAAPSGFYYRITITDPTGQPVAKYTGVVVSGTTWSLDSYIPTTTTIPPIGGTVNGPIAFTGEVTVQPPVNPTDAATKSYVDTGLATKVPTSTTVNGHALTGNVTISASDLTTGTLPHAQLPTLISTDIPLIPESQVINLAIDLGNRVTTTTKVNGHYLFSDVTVSASDITTGTLPHAQLPLFQSGDIPNNAANTSGTAAGLSANIAESQVTNLTVDLGNKVSTNQTVNGHPLAAAIIVSASDITTGTLPHAQLPALLTGDIPNNAANTSGSAGSLSSPLAHSMLPALVSADIPNNSANTSGTAAVATNALSLGGNLANTYAPLASPTFTGTVSGITASMVGLGNVNNTSDATKPVSTATTTAIGVETTRATTAEGLLVPKTTTVNGHALSSNVVVSASDLTTGNLPMDQIPTGGSASTYLRGDGSWATPAGGGSGGLSVYYGADTGTANAYAATTSGISSYTNGLVVFLKVANTNTAASTINVSSVGAVSIVKLGAAALTGGELAAGMVAILVYDSTLGKFQLANPATTIYAP